MKDKLDQYFNAAKNQAPILNPDNIEQMLHQNDPLYNENQLYLPNRKTSPFKLMVLVIAGLLYAGTSFFTLFYATGKLNDDSIPNYKKGKLASTEEFQQLIEDDIKNFPPQTSFKEIFQVSSNTSIDLKKYGIYKNEKEVIFKANIQGLGYLDFSIDTKTKESKIYHSKYYNALLKDSLLDFYPLFVTNAKKEEILQHNFGFESHKSISSQEFNNILNKLVQFHVHNLPHTKDQIIFWFYPSKGYKSIQPFPDWIENPVKMPTVIGYYDTTKVYTPGLTPKDEIESIIISPNPIRNQMNIQITLSQDQKIGLKLTKGVMQDHKRLMPITKIKAGTTEHQFDLTDIPSGIYDLIIEHHGNNRLIQRLIIRKE